MLTMLNKRRYMQVTDGSICDSDASQRINSVVQMTTENDSEQLPISTSNNGSSSPL